MNVLLLTEHYFPKIGGTVSYVEHTAETLSQKLTKVYLLVPAIGRLGSILEEKHPTSTLTILKLGVRRNGDLLYDAIERKVYCEYIRNNAVDLAKKYRADVVHVLHGLFIAASLKTLDFRKIGVKTINTIHNIPPQECSSSWVGDSKLLQFQDSFRKKVVRFVNRRRIKKNEFDVYIVPSEEVGKSLRRYLRSSLIKVIGHGGSKVSVLPKNKPSSSSSIKLLTVGGFVPHKNQLLIPEIARYLMGKQVKLRWDVVGPIRNRRYYDSFLDLIRKYELEEVVHVHHNIPKADLTALYQSADLYLQLSSEEGFCMTVLDAVSHRLPVIATPVGAIPEMLGLVDGMLIDLRDSNRNELIHHYIKIVDELKLDSKKHEIFVSTYTWQNAVDSLIAVYHG